MQRMPALGLLGAASIAVIAALSWLALRPPSDATGVDDVPEERSDATAAPAALSTKTESSARVTVEAVPHAESMTSSAGSILESLEKDLRARQFMEDWPEDVLLENDVLNVYRLSSLDTQLRNFPAPPDALREAALLPGREAKEAAWLVLAIARSADGLADSLAWLRKVEESAREDPAGTMGPLLGSTLLGLALLGECGPLTAAEPSIATRAATGDAVALRAHRVCLLLDWEPLDENRRQELLRAALDPSSGANSKRLWIRLAHEPDVPAWGAMLAAARAGDAAACAGIAAISDGSFADVVAHESSMATGAVKDALWRAYLRSASTSSWTPGWIQPGSEWAQALSGTAEIEDAVGLVLYEAGRDPSEPEMEPWHEADRRTYVASRVRKLSGAHRSDVLSRLHEATIDHALSAEQRAWIARCMVGLDPREYAASLSALRSELRVWASAAYEIEPYLRSLRAD